MSEGSREWGRLRGFGSVFPIFVERGDSRKAALCQVWQQGKKHNFRYGSRGKKHKSIMSGAAAEENGIMLGVATEDKINM